MTRTRSDAVKIRAYNIVGHWHRLGYTGQILVVSVLWCVFVLVAFPHFADLVERAVWGEDL